MVFQPGQSGNPKGRTPGSGNRQLQQIRSAAELVLPQVLAQALGGHFESQELILKLGTPKLKPVELPVEFSLGEGEAAPVRAVLQQAAAGELSLPHAEKLMDTLLPMVREEQRAIARQARPSPSGGSFFNAYLNSVLGGEPPSAPKEKDAEVLALMAEIAGLVK